MTTKTNKATIAEIEEAVQSGDPHELFELVQKENSNDKALVEELENSALRLDELLAQIVSIPGHEDIEDGDESCEVGQLITEYVNLGMRTECLECLTGREDIVDSSKHRRSDGSRYCEDYCPLRNAADDLRARIDTE